MSPDAVTAVTMLAIVICGCIYGLGDYLAGRYLARQARKAPGAPPTLLEQADGRPGSQPEPCLTEFARAELEQLLQVEPRLSQAAHGNGAILADLLRCGSPRSDVEIAGYVLSMLSYARAVQVTCDREAGDGIPDAWRLLTDALAMAAVDLTQLDRLGPSPLS